MARNGSRVQDGAPTAVRRPVRNRPRPRPAVWRRVHAVPPCPAARHASRTARPGGAGHQAPAGQRWRRRFPARHQPKPPSGRLPQGARRKNDPAHHPPWQAVGAEGQRCRGAVHAGSGVIRRQISAKRLEGLATQSPAPLRRGQVGHHPAAALANQARVRQHPGARAAITASGQQPPATAAEDSLVAGSAVTEEDRAQGLRHLMQPSPGRATGAVEGGAANHNPAENVKTTWRAPARRQDGWCLGRRPRPPMAGLSARSVPPAASGGRSSWAVRTGRCPCRSHGYNPSSASSAVPRSFQRSECRSWSPRRAAGHRPRKRHSQGQSAPPSQGR